MTNLEALSPGAQGLVHALESSAQNAAAQRGAGYPQVHEDQVGGVASVQEAIDELRGAGIDVRASQGDRDRMICLVGANGGPVRIARGK